ncbi:hypothetical protein PHYBOEH_009586 [Phytophthora boehmeriae]|uniref:RxLR effector protein n=1 Tax=Phytophthora boehmeriae TaxID=109152 RepID=A0A8T1VSA7_9STRA|nr:hypothetical protein PHYBOEH_009586 [Phytophthora boehmeriae]
MRRYSTLLVVAMATLLVISETFITANASQVVTSNGILSHSHVADRHHANSKRYVRIAKLTDEDDSTGLINTEERTGGVGAVKGFFSNLGTHAKMRVWLEREKPDEYAFKKLGLEGLTGTQLTSHPNYKKFLWYSDKAEGYKLNRWLLEDPPLPTYDGWVLLGLENMVDRNIPMEMIKRTKAFRTYERYVKEFDQDVIILGKTGSTPQNQISRHATPAEMTAKAEIWAKNKMTDDYVIYALGLKGLSREELARNVDFQYFRIFKEAQKAN